MCHQRGILKGKETLKDISLRLTVRGNILCISRGCSAPKWLEKLSLLADILEVCREEHHGA